MIAVLADVSEPSQARPALAAGCEVVKTKSLPLSRGAHERVSAIRYQCIPDDIKTGTCIRMYLGPYTSRVSTKCLESVSVVLPPR
jgi:hypothetical protein